MLDFHKVEPFTEYVVDINLAKDCNKNNDLARFVRTHYKFDYSDFNSKQFEIFNQEYQTMISEAIKSNNLNGVEILWEGIYFHDRDNPYYEHDVEVAAEFGNYKTFQHILYAYMNNMTLNPKDSLNYSKLLELSAKNIDSNVLRFIESLKSYVYNNELDPIYESDKEEDINADEDDKFTYERQKKFYEHIKSFT